MDVAVVDSDTLALLYQLRMLEYFRAAIVTLFFYDYVASFRREVTTIWIGKWTTLNWLYILSRYVPFVNFISMVLIILIDIDPKLCMPMFHFSMWTSSIGISVAEACFCLRAYALWGASRPVGIFLVALFSSMVIIGSVIDGLMAASASMIQPSFIAQGITPQCVLHLEANNYSIYGWIILIAVDTILISMIGYAKIRMYPSFSTNSNTLLHQIYRDAIIYFFCNFLISITSIILYFIAPGPMKAAASIFGLTMFSILSCKIMLQLREYGNSNLLDHDISSVNQRTGLSSLRFSGRRSNVNITLPEE